MGLTHLQATIGSGQNLQDVQFTPNNATVDVTVALGNNKGARVDIETAHTGDLVQADRDFHFIAFC